MLCLLLSCLVGLLLSPEIDVVVLQVGSRVACQWRGSHTEAHGLERLAAWTSLGTGTGWPVLARVWPVLALGCTRRRLGVARSSMRARTGSAVRREGGARPGGEECGTSTGGVGLLAGT